LAQYGGNRNQCAGEPRSFKTGFHHATDDKRSRRVEQNQESGSE